MTTTMIPITGNTYPVREQLRALGGRWNAEDKAWMIPEARSEEARKLVGNVPAPGPRRQPSAVPSQRQQSRRPTYRSPGPGEKYIYRASGSREDPGYQVGEVIRLRSDYLIVVEPQGKWKVGEEDDTHEGEWRCGAIARLATDEESAERRAHDTARERRRAAQVALKAAIDAMPSMGCDTQLPPWATGARRYEMPRNSHYPSVHEGTVYISDDGIAFLRPVYDDDPIIRVALADSPEYMRVMAALVQVEV